MDTDSFNYMDGYDDSLYENQVDNMPHDTEVLNDQDLFKNSEDQQMDQFDNVVVPDSDDEVQDIATNERSFCKRGCFSGSSVRSLCKRNVQAKNLQLNDSRLSEANDKNLVSDIKQMYGNIEVDGDGLMNQVKRKVTIVYTRKRKRVNYTFEDKSLRELMRSPIQGEDYESQEAEDVSKALLFVDQYVSVNAMHSSPVARVVEEKSPPALSAKGAKNLARWANVRNQTMKTGVFEWDPSEGQTDSSVKEGWPSFRGKYFGVTYVRKAPRLRDTISNIAQKNMGDNSKNKELEVYTYSDTNLGSDFENIGDFNQFNGKKSIESHEDMIAPWVDRESALTELGDGVVERSGHVFDVGIDTQMAAEAMQELSFAAPAHCDKSYPLPHMMLSEPLCTLTRCHVQIWFFPKKARSASRRKVNYPRGSWRISTLNDEEHMLQGPDKLSSGKCLAKGSLKNFGKVMFSKRSIIKRPKKVKEDDLQLGNSPYQRKHKAFISDGGNLSSFSLDNINDGTLNESIVRVNKKAYSDDKESDTGVNESNLDLLDQSEKYSKIPNEKPSDAWNMREAEEEKKYSVVDNLKVNQLVDVQINQLKIDKSATTSEVSVVKDAVSNLPYISLGNFENAKLSYEDTSYADERPRNWYMKDYPRGKRTCRNILRHSENKSDHHPSTSLFNSDSSFHLSCYGSTMKRKQRSSVYVSPCWLSSLKNHDGRSIKQRVDKQLTKPTTSMPLGKVATIGATSNACKMSKADLRLLQDKSPLCHQTHAGSPRSPLSNEMFFSDEIVGNCEHGKKKVTTSPLLRELVRLGFNESMPELASKDSRKRKTMASIQVLFSQNLDKDTLKQQIKILRRFGIPMALCPADATHFVTNKFARTRNILEFIAQGKPVVTHMWLESCEQAGSYIDEGNYILRDVKKELEVGFRLPMSLEKARNHPLLKGYWVAVTPSTQPSREMLSSLVKACHGQVIDSPMEVTMKDKTVHEIFLLISCEEDRAYCTPFLQKGIAAYSSELLLNGIIIQKLELERHQLFADHV